MIRKAALVISIALAGGCGLAGRHVLRAGTEVGLALEALAVGIGTVAVVAAATRPPPAPTVVVQPAPVVVQAAPVIVQPATIVVQPTPVVVQPPGVVQPPPGAAQASVEPPAPSGPYSTWIASKGRCTSGREFHVRCVKDTAGQACFFETDDGESFECSESSCGRVPEGLNAWCAASGGAPASAPLH